MIVIDRAARKFLNRVRDAGKSKDAAVDEDVADLLDTAISDCQNAITMCRNAKTNGNIQLVRRAMQLVEHASEALVRAEADI